MNIALTGPMGAGKSEAGRLAAEALGMDFADTDRMVMERTGKTVREIFAADGEDSFRKFEAEAIADISKKDNLVIAVGGGAVLLPRNMRRLRSNGVIVSLEASADILLGRLENAADRPLLAPGRERKAGFERYLRERSRFYANRDFRIDTSLLTVGEVAGKICAIANLPVIRLCGCIAGGDAESDIRVAIEGGISMVELRLDLIPHPDVKQLVGCCAVPVIATDRKDPRRLKEAVLAGSDFVDLDMQCPEREEIIRFARRNGCMTIVSTHDFEGVPDAFPEKGGADFLKIAATLNCPEDFKKLVGLHAGRKDVIIAGMGTLGGLLRVVCPMLGSPVTYCSVEKPTATGQLDLQTMNDIYRGMGLR